MRWRASDVAREELFITSKLNAEWHGFQEAQDAFAMSAEKLGVDYIDLFLIHWPNPRQDRYVDAFRGLVELLRTGRVRAIGLSNFKPEHVQRVIDETGAVPDVNQIELDPTIAREEPRAYHRRHDIVTESWSPLGNGGELLQLPAIAEIAERHGRTTRRSCFAGTSRSARCRSPSRRTPPARPRTWPCSTSSSIRRRWTPSQSSTAASRPPPTRTASATDRAVSSLPSDFSLASPRGACHGNGPRGSSTGPATFNAYVICAGT